MGWIAIDKAPENTPVIILYADSNPPSYDIAVLYRSDEQLTWMNCVAGWLQDKACVLDYIDEIKTPTHYQLLEKPI